MYWSIREGLEYTTYDAGLIYQLVVIGSWKLKIKTNCHIELSTKKIANTIEKLLLKMWRDPSGDTTKQHESEVEVAVKSKENGIKRKTTGEIAECDSKKVRHESNEDSRSGSTKSTSEVVCYECGKIGHDADECSWAKLETSHELKWFVTGDEDVTSDISSSSDVQKVVRVPGEGTHPKDEKEERDVCYQHQMVVDTTGVCWKNN